jgi:hypothetical protein
MCKRSDKSIRVFIDVHELRSALTLTCTRLRDSKRAHGHEDSRRKVGVTYLTKCPDVLDVLDVAGCSYVSPDTRTPGQSSLSQISPEKFEDTDRQCCRTTPEERVKKHI